MFPVSLTSALYCAREEKAHKFTEKAVDKATPTSSFFREALEFGLQNRWMDGPFFLLFFTFLLPVLLAPSGILREREGERGAEIGCWLQKFLHHLMHANLTRVLLLLFNVLCTVQMLRCWGIREIPYQGEWGPLRNKNYYTGSWPVVGTGLLHYIDLSKKKLFAVF